ncbi:hypothetical protein PGUG_03690 [Meyerozyma guilliermondii ATCC 6260]|uniref:Protein CASP n=1 Tax=Meyerozyma guilliermondii (strain ATCC 6260 / CBS 566 / DSM 6381 / JCM 1539 / NBRC 10279 / NRRL Y-324) TaxID=294746 RepID=A5DK89_PICGU|nr:uncharacterized protein PGUG_03690 [Meyerozyma guilliermondii ATCC 6260]EDK39592.2 hypothetical protein PGUG_03690 [Meyerozyma guilliermondii ATCC 6260]
MESDNRGTPQTPPNKFTGALQAWSQIDLPNLQKKLDEQGLEIKEEQKSSLLSRKNLAAKTKEFKKLPDDEKLDSLKSLLKLYQNEIDSLTTKRSNVEKYFFSFYRVMAEAPNPRPLLEASLASVISSSEAETLKKEISDLKDELARRADYDQLKQRMLESEQKAAETLGAKLTAKDDEYKALIDEKESNWQEKEKGLRDQLDSAKNTIEELRTSKEVTELQLNSQSSNAVPADSAAVLAELEMATRDAEFSKKRSIELENRNENLRRELSMLKSKFEDGDFQKENTKKIFDLESENARALATLNQLRNKLQDAQTDQKDKSELYERQINQLTVEVRGLKTKLEETNDYDELKQELHILRQLEFGTDDAEDDESKEFDSLLMQRNKALTKELADIRSQHDGLVEKIHHLEQGLEKTNNELQQAHSHNRKLEKDLQEAVEAHRFNDNASMISGVSRFTTMTRGTANGGEESQSILPIVTKQRDRFRDRCTELEEELRKQTAIISEYKRQVHQLKKDNEELYERTRYLASNGTSTSGRRVFQPKPNMDLENNPYRQSYESKLHPIEQFRMQEQERISSRLSPAERLFISLTRAVLATRVTRMLFLIYCVGLHCVVMIVTIYAMSLNTTMLPEVGLNSSTGGVANGISGSPDVHVNMAAAP